jgi:hypothetical protein
MFPIIQACNDNCICNGVKGTLIHFLVAIMIILGLLMYHACITSCGMHGVHCVCCKRGYTRYPVAENPDEPGDQVGGDGFQNVDLIVPEPESESSMK